MAPPKQATKKMASGRIPRVGQAASEPVTAAVAAKARDLAWEQALEVADGDHTKIKCRSSKWASVLPLSTSTRPRDTPHMVGQAPTSGTGVVKARRPRGSGRLPAPVRHDITAHTTSLLGEIAPQCSDFVLFFDIEHVFRKAFARQRYKDRYPGSGIAAASSYDEFIHRAGKGKSVRVGLFTEFSNPFGIKEPEKTVERHCWAAAFFPESGDRPRTLIHWDGNASAWKQEWRRKDGDKPYQRQIMTKAHRDLSDLVKPAVELFGGPVNVTVNDEQAISIRWITSVATATTPERAFEIAKHLAGPLRR